MISVRIIGPGVDFSIAIDGIEDVEIVERLLAKIRAALSTPGEPK